MNNYLQIKECPITGHDEQIKYFNLGNIPLVNNLCDTREKSLEAERFPLDINYYPASGESSLSIAINGELLFSHYLFKSEINKPYYEHCQKMFKYAQEYIKIEDGTKIIDIGGNDGSLLDAFRSISDKKLELLNIDPSKNLSELCRKKNIPFLTKFFSYDVAKTLDKVDIVTSTNVFQHLFDINSFAKGVECLLNENGIWILEFPYWIHDMKTNQFDQIYHEHMFYHSITPMKMMMEKHNMKIINITKQNIHGGTLRLIIAKKNSEFTPDITVEAYLQLEKNYGLDYHIKWGEGIQQHINNSKNFIKQLKLEGKTIFGFGAAAKGCIYMNAMELTYEDIDYVIDDTDVKQGKYIPGTGIEIVSREILKEKQPDYILILAHNFANYIIESLNLEYSNKFIILIPNIKII
jgi:cyclopropane fatty-acyl-phospholipid synthase-like methyltransferase